MELKKKEISKERQYAKKGEVSKSELKKNSPKKWLVASSLGIASLFYSNPKSIFGTIGVVFGCIEIQASNTTIVYDILNTISNCCYPIRTVTFPLGILLCLVYFVDYIVSVKFKKVDPLEFRKKNKKFFNIVLILFLITICAAIINVLLDNVILELELPIFYKGGVPEYIRQTSVFDIYNSK